MSLRCASHAASDSVSFDGSDGHAHRNGTAPVHPYRLLSPPGPLHAAGPPPSARGDRQTPAISVQKMTPEKKIKKAELKAHVVKLHSVKASSLQEVDVGVLDVLAKRREQFLLRALHYLGIPYKAGARPRSHQPLGAAAMAQAANFDKAPLYLDCCGQYAILCWPAYVRMWALTRGKTRAGLVRRCLLDLADTLDIVVGPYNQVRTLLLFLSLVCCSIYVLTFPLSHPSLSAHICRSVSTSVSFFVFLFLSSSYDPFPGGECTLDTEQCDVLPGRCLLYDPFSVHARDSARS